MDSFPLVVVVVTGLCVCVYVCVSACAQSVLCYLCVCVSKTDFLVLDNQLGDSLPGVTCAPTLGISYLPVHLCL